MKKTFIYFLPYIKNYKKYFFITGIGIIFIATGTILTAHIIKPILDEIFIEKNSQMLMIIPFFLIAIYFLKGAGRFIQGYFTTYIGQSIVKELREKMLEKVLSLDMSFLSETRNGEIISRLNNDIYKVQQIVATMLPNMIRDFFIIIGFIGYLVYQNYELAFFALVILPLSYLPLSYLAKRMKKVSHKSQQKNADMTSRLTEILNNIEIVKANSTEKQEIANFEKDNRDLFKLTMKATVIVQLISPIMQLFGSFGIAMIIIYGGSSVIDGEMTVGAFFAFLTAVTMLIDPIKRVADLINQMQDGIASTERIQELMSRTSSIKSGNLELPKIKTIRFNNISLEYSSKEGNVLNNINFDILKQDSIAFVGNSGGGKSSIINLLIRFYDSTEGEILINNKNIRDYKISDLRKNISIVTQRVYILQDTLFANIIYGSHDLPEDKIELENKVINALKMANALEFVEKLKDGIYTKLNEFGANLSGGQKQRIALARAIFKNSSLLILDEATSALDNKSESLIQDSLQKLTKDKIVITIAHRLSTIYNSKAILFFENGNIIANGKHNLLLQTSEHYRILNK
jgi:subfamily B ATP-binding cassette protein MsbA